MKHLLPLCVHCAGHKTADLRRTADHSKLRDSVTRIFSSENGHEPRAFASTPTVKQALPSIRFYAALAAGKSVSSFLALMGRSTARQTTGLAMRALP